MVFQVTFWWLVVVLSFLSFAFNRGTIPSTWTNLAAFSVFAFSVGCLSMLKNEGPAWRLRDKWRVRRILKKIAKKGGQVWVSLHDDQAKVRAVCLKKDRDAALVAWKKETERLKSENRAAWIRRQTSRVRFYVYPTYTFSYEEGQYRAPAHSGTEKDLGEVLMATLTKILGRRPPDGYLSNEGVRRVEDALFGKQAESRLLIPFLGKGEHGLSLEEQFKKFGGLDPKSLVP